ncbi:MAG: hypothetical protein SFW67_13720 [Myxococcaceae bacterium]|nr:hypothetical protein [Myxococcaceae bacterium]
MAVALMAGCQARLDEEYRRLCQELTGSVDCRGGDGGLPDGGPPDAGIVDGGRDASIVDPTEADAGVVDAGLDCGPKTTEVHCGFCGRQCESRDGGPQCSLGNCLAIPIPFGGGPRALNLPHGLWLVGDRLFVSESDFQTNENRIVELFDGGTIERVTGQPAISAVVVRDGELVWTTWVPGTIRARSLDGGPIRDLFSPDGGGSFFDLKIQVGTLYAAQLLPRSALVVISPENLVVRHEVGGPGATGVAFCDGEAFLAIQQGPPAGAVVRIRAPGSPDASIDIIANDLDMAWGIACDTRAVYVTEFKSTAGRLLRIERSSGGMTTMADTLRGARGIAVDGEDVFVVEYDRVQARRAYRFRADGGRDLLASDVEGGIFPRVDERYLYWVNNRDPGSVVRVTRPPR